MQELADLFTAAVTSLLDSAPRGAQLLLQAIDRANSMGTTATVYAAVEAHTSHVGTTYRELGDTENQLQEAQKLIETLRQELAVTRGHAVALRNEITHRSNRDRPAAPKRRPRAMPPPAADVAGQDRRPDPGAAQTPAELMATLREFRKWAGEPPYRVMAERSGWGASTLNTIITSTDLPNKLVKVDAVLIGCGATQEDHERFASAWRRLKNPGTTARDQTCLQTLSGEKSLATPFSNARNHDGGRWSPDLLAQGYPSPPGHPA